ncbi:M48 family metalloprotease [Candidatus Omnitrophota bacterium]
MFLQSLSSLAEIEEDTQKFPADSEVSTQQKTFEIDPNEVQPKVREKIREKRVKKDKTSKKLVADWVSVEEEIQFGHYVDALIINQYIVLEDSPVVSAVQNIGKKVVEVSHRPELPYKFKVVNTPEVNAFAGPGGYVYITTGLLDILETKDEVAAVLGHELGHICERHSIRGLQNAQNTQIVGGLLSVAAFVTVAALTYDGDSGTSNVDLSCAAGQAAYMATVMVKQGYCRVYEDKADELGILYIHKAGYDASAMIGVLEKLKKLDKEKRPDMQYTLLSTHPSPKSRIKNVRKTLNEIQ